MVPTFLARRPRVAALLGRLAEHPDGRTALMAAFEPGSYPTYLMYDGPLWSPIGSGLNNIVSHDTRIQEYSVSGGRGEA